MVLIIIGLISSITLTNSNFLQKYESDQIQLYKNFIEFLSEESALTKNNIAWFIGNDAQYVAAYKNKKWQIQNLDFKFFPTINSNMKFQDNYGNWFLASDNRSVPFLIFYPSGQSSGGIIQFNKIDIASTLNIDRNSLLRVLPKK